MELNELKKLIRDTDVADVNGLLKYAGRLSKYFAEEQTGKRIAVLGTCNIQYFTRALQCILFRDGIEATFYEGEYDGIKMDVLGEKSSFYSFEPEIVVLIPDYRDIKKFPALLSSLETVSEYISAYYKDMRNIWEHINEKLPNVQIVMANYVLPIDRSLGNLEINYGFSRQMILQELNLKISREHPRYVTIVDMEYQAALIGKLNWFDESGYMLNKSPFSLSETGRVAEVFAKVIEAYCGKVRKCLVLDLDNTLWGGVVSEEGAAGIKIDPNDAVGEAYLSFQTYVKRLNERGIILAVCSKNDMEIAKEPFVKNRNMVLKLENFACFHANWRNKAENIRQIAQEINIGLDSIVLFDDNPAEREIVKMQLQEVLVIEVPQEPAEYVRTLETSNAFCWTALTKEDLSRSETYKADVRRGELQQAADNYDEYLIQLKMKGKVKRTAESDLLRVSQLVNKSNQFNLRTVRYTEAEITALSKDPDVALLSAVLSDKFSNYGIISCVILKRIDKECFIDTWVMSCRVLKRGMELMMFQKIYDIAIEWGCECIKGEYIPTVKNGMVHGLLADLGFDRTAVNDNGSEDYSYHVQNVPTLKFYIEEDVNL